MADNIVGGLFGVSPEALQRSRAQQDYARNLQAVQLTPMQQGNLMLRQGATELGNAGMGLLGVEDPEMQKVTAIKQLSSQFDLTTAAGMRQFAGALQQIAPNEAMMAAKRADEMAVSAATVTQKTRERQIPTSGLGKLLYEKKELLDAGVPPTDPRVVAYDRAIAAEGEGKGTKISIDQRGESAFRTNLAAKDSERVNNAEKIIDSAVGTLNTLKQMTETNNVGVISGTGAEARLSALRFLDTAGFTTPAEKNKLANSENFEKLTGDLVLERIKQLGTNPSNADREFINKIVPQLSTSELARKQLITYMSTRANQVIQEASAVSDYGRKNDSLKGYKPTIPLLNITTPNRPITSYSTEELTAMQNQRK